MRLAGSGEGDRGDADGTTADDRRERRSRPSRPNRTRTPTDPETNRQRALNTRVSTAPDAVSALREFAEAHRAFPNGVNDVNVAALFVVLARSNRLCSSRGTSAAHLEGGDDETFESSTFEESSVAFARTVVADLLVRLSELAPNTTGRVCANVLHALGQLEAREWWTRVKTKRNGGGGGVPREGEDVFEDVLEDAATSVARRAARTASAMNAQELANAYNGISRLDAFVAASVSHAGWVALSEALVTRATQKRTGTSDFAALAAVLALNALASDKLAAAASATSQSAFDALISVAARAKQWDDSEARAVEKLSEQGLANVLNACAKLEKARLAVERLETAAPRDEDEDEDELSRFRDEGDDETKTKTKRNGWRLFTSRVASLAPRFGDQGLSVALHALTLCGDDARASVDDRGWRAFAEATERLAPTASPQAAAMLLNAAWKLRAEPSARGFYFAPSALDALGRRTAEILLEDDANRTLNARKKKRTFLLDEQATFVAADALGKLPAARAGFAAVAALSAKKKTRATRKDAWFLLAERLANRVIEDDVYEKQKQERVVSGGGGPAASFHVLARVPELAQALTTKRVWRDVGASLCLLAPSLDAEDCARVLNGYAKQRRNALVLESTPKTTLKALARRVAMLAASEDVEAAHVATLADALKKLSVARGEFDALAARNLKRPFMEPARNPWDDLAVVIASSADLLEPLQVTNVVSALGWLEPLASALARVNGGWRRVLAAAARRADSIKRGANESIAASAPDFSEAPEARKWLEKTSAGFELVRGHTEYLAYGDERDRERLVALETEFRNALARIAGD